MLTCPDGRAQQPDRRRVGAERELLLNNLPLAARLARDGADDHAEDPTRFGRALVGLVDAAASFGAAGATGRFGAHAEPRIAAALAESADPVRLAGARATIAAAIASRQRVRELAAFLGVPPAALGGGLADALRSDGRAV